MLWFSEIISEDDPAFVALGMLSTFGFSPSLLLANNLESLIKTDQNWATSEAELLIGRRRHIKL